MDSKRSDNWKKDSGGEVKMKINRMQGKLNKKMNDLRGIVREEKSEKDPG
jgi:hypothetical protein